MRLKKDKTTNYFLIKTSMFLAFMLAQEFVGAGIHVVFTSALIPKKFEERKQDYLKSLFRLRSFGLDPWIVEATHINRSFFDKVSSQVLYVKTNDLSISNKGVNEVMSMKAGIGSYPFDDNDTIIKLTGRYLLRDPFLINTIQATSEKYDAYVSYGKHFVSSNHIFTGCFAMKWKFFKRFLNEWDLEEAERASIPVERALAEFVDANQLKACALPSLHVLAKVFFSGDDESPLWEF